MAKLINHTIGRSLAPVMALNFLAACTPSSEENRKKYLSACATSASHLVSTTNGRVTAVEYCPCIYDATLSRVETKYTRFASHLLLISAGVYPLSHQGVASYASQIQKLLSSRHDGNAAYFHALKALKAAQPACMKTL